MDHNAFGEDTGVSKVMFWKGEDNMDFAAKVSHVQHLVETMAGSWVSRWNGSVHFKKKKDNIGESGEQRLRSLGLPESNKVYFISLSDLPERVFVVDDKEEISEVSTTIEEAATKANLYMSRVRLKIEGQTYQCGDFIINIGSCVMGSTLKNIALEISYSPFLQLNSGLNVINDFLEGVGEMDNFQEAHQWHENAPETFTQHSRISQFKSLFSKLL
mmetsp:Transcript_13202/g.17401  ORF Transcript_13202/g.17401 Transcript_13202/m.17401 type:complete len:216 (-) Transcript_13202:185-832(-)